MSKRMQLFAEFQRRNVPRAVVPYAGPRRCAMACIRLARGEDAPGRAGPGGMTRLDVEQDPTGAAEIRALRGDAKRAPAWLDRIVAARAPTMVTLRGDPIPVPALRHAPRPAARAPEPGLPGPASASIFFATSEPAVANGSDHAPPSGDSP